MERMKDNRVERKELERSNKLLAYSLITATTVLFFETMYIGYMGLKQDSPQNGFYEESPQTSQVSNQNPHNYFDLNTRSFFDTFSTSPSINVDFDKAYYEVGNEK